MRILKKLVRKLYHLIWFLSLFILFVVPVYAAENAIPSSIFSSDISASSSAAWYNTSHNGITINAISENGYAPYYRATPGETSYLSFNIYTNLQPDYAYSITVYLNRPSANLTTWNNLVATGTYNDGANNNNLNGTCRASIYSFVDTWSYRFPIIQNKDMTSQGSTGAYYITFVPTCSGTFLNIPVSFTNSQGYVYFYGYHIEVLGSTTGLTSSEVQNIISNSGLATASSVQEVQRGVNEVKQELSGVQDSIDDVNDTLNDDNVDSSNTNDTLEDLQDELPTNSVISDLLLLPIRFLQNFVNALGGSCSQFNLGSLYGTNLVMPCINIQNYVGSAIWTFIDLVFSGIFVLTIRKKFIQIWENITNLKGGANEVD